MLRRLLKSLGRSKPTNEITFYVKCNRCGEVIQGRVNLTNDLSIVYPEDGGDDFYFARKVLVGSERCFQRIETEFEFDLNRKMTRKQSSGGEFVSEDEYSAGLKS